MALMWQPNEQKAVVPASEASDLPLTVCALPLCRHIGGSSSARKAVDVDYGSVHFEVSQLDFVLDM
jgi:hypothetical protein